MIKINYLLLIILFYYAQISAQKSLTKQDSIAMMYARKSWIFKELQSDSAIFYANKGIEYSIKNKSYLGHLLNLENKGIFYEEVLNNYEEAAKIYFEAIEIAEKHEKGYLSTLFNDLTILFTTKGDYEKAILYGKKAVESSLKGKRFHQYQSALSSLGFAQSLAKKYDDAQKTFNQYLKLKNEHPEDRNIVVLRIAKNYKEQGFNEKAQPLLLKVVQLDSLKGKKRFSEEYMELIENSIILNEEFTIKKYLPLLNKTIENEKRLNVKNDIFKTYSLVYSFLGDTKKALDYQKKFIETTDSINARLNKKQIVELETQYQTKKKEAQIIEEQSKRELWTYISIFAFIILIVVAILLFNNSKKRKQLNANKIELEKLLNQRNMLLRETHHRVKNSFQMVSSLLQLQAQGSEAEVAVTALDSAVERVNSMIVLHQQLYAKDNLLGVDLQMYIKDLVTEINTSYVDENITFNTNISSVVVDIDTATSLGLLVNELATNSIKYAWKNSDSEKIITINLEEKVNEIHFSVFDNGTSKKTKTTKQNYGSELIEILVERLEAEQIEIEENDFGLYITFKK